MMIPRNICVLTVIAAMTLTACGRGDTAETEQTAQAISAGPATGTVTIWAQGTEGEALPEVLEAFEADNPDVDVQVTAVPWDEAQNKYQTAVAGDATPDIGMLGTDWMPSFRDALEPTPDEVDVSGMFPESVASTELGETRYGVPWYVETRVIFYRTDLMRQAGFDTFPTTWDGFKQLARAMQEKAGAKYGVNLPSGGWNSFLGLAPFFWSGGAEITDGTRWTFDTPEMAAGVDYVNSFFTEGIANANPDAAAGEAAAALVDGSIPMMISGPWDVGQVTEAGGPGFADKFAVAPIPASRTSTSLVAGANLVVFKNAKNSDAAWKFIRWLSEPQTQIAFFMPLCGPPLATLAILTFLGSWNNFLWPLVVAQSQDMYTLPVALSLYSTGQNATQYGILLAGSVLVITPMLLLFVFLQRYFTQGIATTGIK